MHELGMVRTVLDRVEDRAAELGVRVAAVHLLAGDDIGVSDDALRFYWDEMSIGTRAEGSALEIEHTPTGGLRLAAMDVPTPKTGRPRLAAEGAQALTTGGPRLAAEGAQALTTRGLDRAVRPADHPPPDRTAVVGRLSRPEPGRRRRQSTKEQGNG